MLVIMEVTVYARDNVEKHIRASVIIYMGNIYIVQIASLIFAETRLRVRWARPTS